MSRSSIEPLLQPIPAARQEDARHYGVHPYFTRRPANVVREYLKRYSRKNDVVLDPFGGTGVTAIEAFLLGRNGIQNDLNPFANFIARNIADTSLPSTGPLQEAFAKVKDECLETIGLIEQSESKAEHLLKELPLPKNIPLPNTSDADFFYDMFSPRQMAGIALIKKAIDAHSRGSVRDSLLLAWSASIAKLNKTFLSAKGRAESRGGSSIFSIYRYKLASECVELPIWETFEGRFSNVLAAKKEVLQIRDYHKRQGSELDSRKHFKVLSEDAAKLDKVLRPGSVDYIFTDPPYGGFITYLDLSILWNHWLGFSVSEETRQSEIIVGGQCDHSEDHYKTSLRRSIEASLHLLKPDRWFSIVFQHWDISYFATILETADECGAQLKAAITQTGDVIWSMHKKKNSESVIAGEMIITFYKPASARRQKVKNETTTEPDDPTKVLDEVFDSCLRNGIETFTSEALFNRLIMELWRRRSLGCLNLDRDEFVSRLKDRGWTYSSDNHAWTTGELAKATTGQIGLL